MTFPKEAAVGGDLFALLRPTETACDGLRTGGTLAGPGRTFVDHHRDVAAEIPLNSHHLFWPEEQFRAVEMGWKRYAVVADVAQFRQRENLKAAAVRENRAI